MIHTIKSATAIHGSAGSFYHIIRGIQGHNKVSLVQARLPKSFYNLNTDSSFKLDNTTITLLKRNYDVDDLLTALNAIGNLTVLFDEFTGLFTFSSNMYTTITVDDRALNSFFGMPTGTHQLPYTSASPVNLDTISSLYLNINIARDDSYGSALTNLAVISASATNTFSMVHYKTSNTADLARDMMLISGAHDQVIHIEITNEIGERVNFNGLDVMIQIKTWTKRPNIEDVIYKLIDTIQLMSSKGGV